MRRVRLNGTAYGEVPAVAEAEDITAARRLADDDRPRTDRWVIRRSALSRQLVLDAQAVFEDQLKRPVSENEARNFLGNLADYMWMLVKWEVGRAAGEPVVSDHEPGEGARNHPKPRPRGRPRKKPVPESPPRPRGRPRKNPVVPPPTASMADDDGC